MLAEPSGSEAETPSFSPLAHFLRQRRGEELGAGGIRGVGHLGSILPCGEFGSALPHLEWQVTLLCTLSPGS